jgi:hypothetical protein
LTKGCKAVFEKVFELLEPSSGVHNIFTLVLLVEKVSPLHALNSILLTNYNP